MSQRLIVALFLIVFVECGRNFREGERFLDVYTNYENIEDVLRTFHEIRNETMNKRVADDRMDSGENSDEDTFDFHYPKVEFLTKVEKVLVMKTSTTKKPPLRNRRSRFPLRKYNKTEYQPVRLSYVQKITKDNSTSNNKYEEADLGSTHSPPLNASRSIHQILKSYLMKLYDQKYNSTKPSRSSKGQTTEEEDPKTKFLDSLTGKLKDKSKFSLFTIVKFNNTKCNVTDSGGSYQGVCYTADECSQISGTASGSCADGYGVCCIAKGSCGGWASQNCSYFESPGYPDYYPSDGGVIIPSTVAPTTTTANPSPTPDPRLHWHRNYYWARQNDDDRLSCVFSVYKTNSNVNRMRIDFLDLELAGPTNGACTMERLVVTGQDVNDRVPDICGYNTGQHIYVDVSMLSGPLQLSVLSTVTYRKRFRIRICQYDNSCNEPPSNCLQYYTGVTGNITSFNYGQASTFNRSVSGYFNNLNYAICIRREAGYCSITYRNQPGGVEYPFQLVNVNATGNRTVTPGEAGLGVVDCPDDYVVIDGVRLCGDKFNDGTVNANASLNAPVTDSHAGPIVIPVRTDSSVTGVGFKLFYTQNKCAIN